MNFASFLPVIAAAYGSRAAVSVGEEQFCDYATLHRRVGGLAASMEKALGLTTGDRVCLFMRNSPQYLEILLACWHGGLCCVPVNAKLHVKELGYIIRHTGSKVCFTSEDLQEVVSQHLGEMPALTHHICVDRPYYDQLIDAAPVQMAQVHENDPAWLFYTSGTTGRPKGATLSHRNLLGMSLRYYADIGEVDHSHCYLHAAPMSHGSGLYGLPHMMKGSHQIITPSRGFDVDEIFDVIDAHRRVTLFAAPTMLTRLTNHPRSARVTVDNIDTIFYGGAPMYVEDLKRAIKCFGPRLCQIFGQGESPMTGLALPKILHGDFDHPKYGHRLGSTGIARTGVEVRIVDRQYHDVPTGELGEILLRSEVTMLGYWNDKNATDSAIRDGWLCTGDIGSMDEDGFVTVHDRSKDMIISGGINIYPREIEEVIMTCPRVLEVAVVGRPNREWGEDVVAFVVPRAGASVTEEELDTLCLDNIARFKRPKAYFFLDSLPKSNYGKVLKTVLRGRLSASVGGAS